MIQPVRRAPPRPQPARPIFVRNQSYRRNPSNLYDVSRTPTGVGLKFVLDSRYHVNNTSQAMFMQGAAVPMVFAVPITPNPDATNVSSVEDLQVHMISVFTNTASCFISINGVPVAVTLTPTYGGVLMTGIPGAYTIVKAFDGKAHLHGEGLEDVSGVVTVDWTVTPRPVPPRISKADGKIPMGFPLGQRADGKIPMGIPYVMKADGTIQIRHPEAISGSAAGRLFVGEFFWHIGGSMTFNVAETFRTDSGSITHEILGYALFAAGIIPTWNTQGWLISDVTPVVYDIANRTIFFTGTITYNIGPLTIHRQLSVTWNTLGEQADPQTMGRLILRVSSLPADLVAELEAAGIIFTP